MRRVFFQIKKKKVIAFLNLLKMSLELLFFLCRYRCHSATDNALFLDKHTKKD